MKLKHEIGTANAYVDVYGSMQYSKNIQKMIDHIRQGFNSGLKPKLTDDGTSGAYELRNPQKKKVAIFKPIDEEPFAPNNPRGNTGSFGT